MSRADGERCVEIARQVRDGEYCRDLGAVTGKHEAECLGCGCPTVVTEHERGVDGGYCPPCHHQISQEIYEHECRLLESGYYGE